MRAAMASFKDCRRKKCCFLTTWIIQKAKDYRLFLDFRYVCRVGSLINSRLQEEGIPGEDVEPSI